MTFAWPWALLLLLIPLLLLALYIWALRRRRKAAVSYASLSLIRAALPQRARWRQHLPFALFLFGLTSLLFSVSRPEAVVEVPLSRTTMILALDVSRSMCATDIDPNRLTVAQAAALSFIDEQAEGTRIGIVAFAGFAELIVPPTHDKGVLLQAVANLTTSLGTAIGSATLKSIDAIALVNEAVPASGVNLTPAGDAGAGLDVYQPDIIVLLTDGANSQGPPPLSAAEQAAARGVRVYTIGFGTANPTNMVCTQEQLGSDVFGGGFGGGFGGNFGGSGFGGGFRRYLVIDEPTLQGIAEMTGGAYFRAENAAQLQAVFRDLPAEIVLQPEHIEISVAFVAVALLALLVAVGLSLRWRRFP